MQETLTMRRQGEFGATVMGLDHCGIANHNTQQKMKYEVMIECTSTSRDHRGFLFDQLTVHNYFLTLQYEVRSCENMAVDAARDLMNLIHAENPKCKVRSIQVVISAAPYFAEMRYLCEAPARKYLTPTEFYRTRGKKLHPKPAKRIVLDVEEDDYDDGPF